MEAKKIAVEKAYQRRGGFHPLRESLGAPCSIAMLKEYLHPTAQCERIAGREMDARALPTGDTALKPCLTGALRYPRFGSGDQNGNSG